MIASLVYGKLQKKKAQELTELPVIDVSQPDWKDKVTQLESDPSETFLLCTDQAYMLAKKRLPKYIIVKSSIDKDSLESNDTEPKISAVRIGDTVVSKRFHPATIDSKIWLTTYHLDLIKELFKEGFVIELLDNSNNLITTFGDKNE